MQNLSNRNTKKAMDQQQPPPRRAYQRYTAEAWDKHRDIIRRLFLDQDKTYKEVLAVLEQDHGLTIGERQLKRKTEEWGFFKNIPSKEMEKMVRTQARRKRRLGRPTQFHRRQGDGEFYNVPPAKIALHERRMDMGSLSPTSSTSSGLPSNIECFTPQEPVMVTTPTSLPSTTRSCKPTLPPASAVLLAAEFAMDAKYQEAASRFRQLSKLTSSPWGSVLFDFNADIMDGASNGGCPQTVAARVSNVLSQYLFRQREQHRVHRLLSTANEEEETKVLAGLRMNARFWGSVVVQQRALQIWEPILGSDHPKIVRIHEGLALKRRGKVVNLDTNMRMVKLEDLVSIHKEPDEPPSVLGTTVKDEGGLFYLGDRPPDKLMGQLEPPERAKGERFSHEMAMLRFGRLRALAGLHYSFADRFADAQIAFHDSAETLEYETCVEIKLHRILWEAEHKTRIHDWEGAWDLLRRSHKVFLDAEAPSEFFNTHFMHRFKVLGEAIGQRRSVDKASGLWDMNELMERVDDLQLPAAGLESSSVLEPFRSSAREGRSAEVMGFPPASLPSAGGSSDANMGIDIGAWRDFVNSSLSPT